MTTKRSARRQVLPTLAIGVFVALLGSTMVRAQQVIDGSGSEVDPAVLADVLKQVGGVSGDLQSAQFRSLRKGSGGSVVCGDVKGPNVNGDTFTPFYFDLPSGRTEIMPDPDSAEFEVWLARSGLLCH